MEENGLIHIYCGSGKGKTTCAMGLIMRCAGQGGRVLCFQFLKSDVSGERRILAQLEQVTLLPCYENVKFTSRMTAQEKEAARTYYQNTFEQITQRVGEEHYDLLVLDEILAAIANGLLSQQSVITFLKEKPQTLEVVLTGRDPSEELLTLADYVTEMQLRKHPYERGVKARRMIEW